MIARLSQSAIAPVFGLKPGVSGSDSHLDREYTTGFRLGEVVALGFAVPLLKVGDLLGHADIRTTQRYAHLAPQEQPAYLRLLSAASPGQTSAKRRTRSPSCRANPNAVRLRNRA